MPVYNGERYIAKALDSLIAQDFRDWTMTVADNCSTDGTAGIVQAYCERDSRIRLVRHGQNIGAVNNFLFLVRQAQSPFFMWAAADDEWSANYIGDCIALLQQHPDVGFASGTVVNTDLQGTRLRDYASFAPFESHERGRRIRNFVRAREVNGKANMIYSVYRTPLVQAVCAIPDIFDGWGSDMAFVAAVLARARYLQASQAILFKRVISDSDVETSRLIEQRRYGEIQFEGHYPPPSYQSYVSALRRGMPTPGLSRLVQLEMVWRRFSLYLRRCFDMSK